MHTSRRTRWFLWILAVLAAGLGACGDPRPDPDARPRVFVSILPQAYLVERIAGEHIDVEVLVGPGDNPHSYSPTPKQMVRLGQANALLTLGLPFEQELLGKLHGHDLRIVNLGAGLAEDPHTTDDHAHGDEQAHDDEHDHGDEQAHDDEHDHGESDPHVWLSPVLASELAEHACDALIEIDPAHAEDFRRNLAELQADLKTLDAELAETLAPLKGQTFYVFHPAFGHFAGRYGLVQRAVETGGKAPGPRHVDDLIAQAKANDVHVIFVQPQFSDRAARAIAEQIGGVVVPIDPLAGDYLANLRRVADRIRQGLAPTHIESQTP